jgi:hypothetical protein
VKRRKVSPKANRARKPEPPGAQSWDEWNQELEQGVLRLPRIPDPWWERNPWTAKPADPKGKRKQRAVGGGRVWRAVQGAVLKLYPPKGKVPDSVSTETVKNQVIGALGYPMNWNGWHTVNRVIGRE